MPEPGSQEPTLGGDAEGTQDKAQPAHGDRVDLDKQPLADQINPEGGDAPVEADNRGADGQVQEATGGEAEGATGPEKKKRKKKKRGKKSAERKPKASYVDAKAAKAFKDLQAPLREHITGTPPDDLAEKTYEGTTFYGKRLLLTGRADKEDRRGPQRGLLTAEPVLQPTEDRSTARELAGELLGNDLAAIWRLYNQQREAVVAAAAEQGNPVHGDTTYVEAVKVWKTVGKGESARRKKVTEFRTAEQAMDARVENIVREHVRAVKEVATWVKARAQALEKLIDQQAAVAISPREPKQRLFNRIELPDMSSLERDSEIAAEIAELQQDLATLKSVMSIDSQIPESVRARVQNLVAGEIYGAELAVVGGIEVETDQEVIRLVRQRDVETLQAKAPKVFADVYRAVQSTMELPGMDELTIDQTRQMFMKYQTLMEQSEEEAPKGGIEFTISETDDGKVVHKMIARSAGYEHKIRRLQGLARRQHRKHNGIKYELNQVELEREQVAIELGHDVVDQLEAILDAQGDTVPVDRVYNIYRGLLDQARDIDPNVNGGEWEFKKTGEDKESFGDFVKRRLKLFRERKKHIRKELGITTSEGQTNPKELKRTVKTAIAESVHFGEEKKAMRGINQTLGSKEVGRLRKEMKRDEREGGRMLMADRATVAMAVRRALNEQERRMGRRNGDKEWKELLGVNERGMARKRGDVLRVTADKAEAKRIAAEAQKLMRDRISYDYPVEMAELPPAADATEGEDTPQEVVSTERRLDWEPIVENVLAGVEGLAIFNPHAERPVKTEEELAVEKANKDTERINAVLVERIMPFIGDEYADFQDAIIGVMDSKDLLEQADDAIKVLEQFGDIFERISNVVGDNSFIDGSRANWLKMADGLFEENDGVLVVQDERQVRKMVDAVMMGTISVSELFRFKEQNLAIAYYYGMGEDKTAYNYLLGNAELSHEAFDALVVACMDSQEARSADFNVAEATKGLATTMASSELKGDDLLIALQLATKGSDGTMQYDHVAMRSAMKLTHI